MGRRTLKKPGDKIDVLGIPVSPVGVGHLGRSLGEKPLDESLLITFVNPRACVLANQHDDYVQLLESFNVVACDGIGMVKAARACSLAGLRRESFDDTSLAPRVFQWAVLNEKRIGLIGGEPGVAAHAADVLRYQYPGLQIVASYSGFDQDPDEARQFFLDNHTDVVICGMGAPAQERFLLQLTVDCWLGIGFTCGGFLDQLAAGPRYYPAWIDRLNIRFLYRLFKEPRRLWRRYFVDYQVFLRRYANLQWKRFKSIPGNGKSSKGTR